MGPMMQFQSAGFLNRTRTPVQVFGAIEKRAFSYPEHLVMEMPNLSPTMEKVSSLNWLEQTK